MINPIRSRGTRISRKYTRTLSTGVSASDSSTLADAFATIGSLVKGAPEISAQEPPKNSSSPDTTSSPHLMDIPPAEDPLLHYFTSSLLRHGHRAKAARITSRTLLHIHAFTRAPPLPILRNAIQAASPAVRCMMHRQGAKTIAKPIALGEKQRTRYAVQWILKASDSKSGQTVEERLARELIAVLQGSSEVLKKKDEVHKFAMVNRGNAQWRV